LTLPTNGSGGGGITQLIQDVSAGPGTGSQAATVVGIHTVPLCTGFSPSNGQVLEYTTASSPNPCYTAVSPSSTPGAPYTQPFVSQTTVALAHNLGLSPVTAYVLECWNSASPPVKIQPATETATDANTVTVTFATAQSGTCTVSTGGTAKAAGALVLVEQHTASASASLNFTTCITSTYDTYLVTLVDLAVGTDADNIYVRMSTNGGASYDSGANYSIQHLTLNTSSVPSNASSLSQISIAGSVSSASAVSGEFFLYGPLSASLAKVIEGKTSYITSGRIGHTFTGAYEVATAANAFQLIASTGTLASGTARCYGVAK
jgi:hypothetical protein